MGARQRYMKHTVLNFCFDLASLYILRERQSLLIVAVRELAAQIVLLLVLP